MLAYLHSFDVMVGPHGAGLANALYMPPCGVVAQLKGKKYIVMRRRVKLTTISQQGSWGETGLFENIAKRMGHGESLL